MFKLFSKKSFLDVSTGLLFSETAFYVLDKMASIIFALVVLLFVFLWVYVIHGEIYPRPRVMKGVAIGFVAFAVALVVSSCVLVIQYGDSHTIYQRTNLYISLDFVDLLMSAVLFAVGIVLVLYILITFRYFYKMSQTTSVGSANSRSNNTARDDERKKGQTSLQIILALSIVFLISFLVRLVLVFLAAFDTSTFYGWTYFYGFGTLFVEVVGTILILAVITIKFHSNALTGKDRSRDRRSGRDPKGHTNSSELEVPLLSYDEQEEEEIPEQYRV